ncbi:hypothetical protein A9Q99_00965 [Gammaproteobacteria bacterium 45_16_T64]|nr:hypothetical protein A9Q99_00965 [Gammaproteobacteria bacterium 45_16_T64]
MTTTASLKKRFFSHTALIVVLVMLMSATVVYMSFVKELEKSAQDKLRLHIYTLLSVSQFNQGALTVPPILHNARFNTENSGLWAMVVNSNKQQVWHSLSVIDPVITSPPTLATGQWLLDKQHFGGTPYLTISYKVAWEEYGAQHEYTFVVAEDESVIKADLYRFQISLALGFLIITAAVLIGQHLALKQAFKPIKKLEDEINDMEIGSLTVLSTDYPKELKGVTHNVNSLIDKEHRQRERYRSSMADLAHSLKTPMTIIRSEISDLPENRSILDAIFRIDNSIEYQLRRAVISSHTIVNQGTNIETVLGLVVDAMDKIYRDKSVEFTTNVDSDASFRGDENDLMEILGNLLDNAYKHTQSAVQLNVNYSDCQLIITVEDDGPGISEAATQVIFTRGERLDCQGLGQGIGLAVVYDIVTSYNGSISANHSPLGGAIFTITFSQQGSIS